MATAPAWVADGLAHPGAIALPGRDGRPVRTRATWSSDDDAPIIHSLMGPALAPDITTTAQIARGPRMLTGCATARWRTRG